MPWAQISCERGLNAGAPGFIRTVLNWDNAGTSACHQNEGQGDGALVEV